jgi:sugar phosphate isomerase/epimerase
MTINRRAFVQYSLGGLAAGLSAPALRAASKTQFKIGVTDWNLHLSSQAEAVAMAKKCGFQGVQVALGRKVVDDKLPLDNAEVQQTYLSEAKKNGIALTSTCLDRLHNNYLKNDKLGQKWVSDGIRITKALGLEVMLLPFFGKGALENHAEMDYVGDALRELGPEAEAAGVILGLEDTVSAEDNVRMMERSRSKAVWTYYDIGNSSLKGFDPVKEIRWLGKPRICEVHIKDNPHYLGEGKIDIAGVVNALADIGYDRWTVLETDTPSKDVLADMKRNLGYFQGRIKQHNASA